MIFKNDEWHKKSFTPTSNHFEFLEWWDELWFKFHIQIIRMCLCSNFVKREEWGDIVDEPHLIQLTIF
jgi:hypothetical protein